MKITWADLPWYVKLSSIVTALWAAGFVIGFLVGLASTAP